MAKFSSNQFNNRNAEMQLCAQILAIDMVQTGSLYYTITMACVSNLWCVEINARTIARSRVRQTGLY